MRNHTLFGKAMLTEFVGRNVWIVTFQDGSGAGLELPDSAAVAEMRDQLGESGWDRLRDQDRWRDTWKVSHALTDSGMNDPAGDRLMKRVAVDAISESPGTFGKKTLRRWINFWRTRATELPRQAAEIEAGHDTLFQGEPTWGVIVAPVDTALRFRYSNWLPGNTFLMLLTAASTMLLLWRRDTRAAGLWFAAVLGYFATITAVLEIPAYRYRMIIEPVVLIVVALAVAEIAFPKPSPASEPVSENTHA